MGLISIDICRATPPAPSLTPVAPPPTTTSTTSISNQ
ncbi:hypothetical protein OROHE_004563 [Orobanche hederae]